MSFCVCIEEEFCVRHIEGESGKKTGVERKQRNKREANKETAREQ